MNLRQAAAVVTALYREGLTETEVADLFTLRYGVRPNVPQLLAIWRMIEFKGYSDALLADSEPTLANFLTHEPLP